MAAYWATAAADPAATDSMLDFARIWNEKPKVVFPSTLESGQWNSRLTSAAIGEELARLRTEFEGDMSVGGAIPASEFMRRGRIDEYRLLVHPAIQTPFDRRLTQV